MSSHRTLVQPSHNFSSASQKKKKKKETRNQNKACPFLTSSRFSSLFCPSNMEAVKSYLQCETKHNALKSANTQQTTKQTGVHFFPFIYSFWTWCRLDQTPGYRRIWEQGVNLWETAVCGGLGGRGEEKGMFLLTEREKRSEINTKVQHTQSSQLARSAVHSNIITVEQHQAAAVLYSNQFTDELLHASATFNPAFRFLFSLFLLGLQGF